MRGFCLWSVVALAALPGARAGDFPQWRGPLRNGVVADSPPLAATWPKDGPKELWRSERVLKGGFGSLAVASGRVYAYVNEGYKVPLAGRTLSESGLRGLGWSSKKPPEALSKAVEAARVGEERTKIDRSQRDEWIKKWVAENVTEEHKKFRHYARDRLYRGAKAIPLAVFAKLETIQDKEFAGPEALEKWLAEAGIEGEVKKSVLRAFPTHLNKAWDRLWCFDAADGKTVWGVKHDAKPSSSASSTPCVADGRCYVAGTDGMIYCHDAADGRELWKAKAPDGGGTIHSSVLVADGAAVVLAGRLTAFDAEKGTVRWQQKKVRGSNNSPVAWRSGGKTYALCNTGGELACVDIADGQIAWRVPGGSLSTAAVDGPHMAVFTRRKKLGLALYKIAPDRAELLWSLPQIDKGETSPLIYKGHVYAFCHKLAVCAELATGGVLWEQKTASGGCSSPVAVDGKIVAFTGRKVQWVRATPAGFELLAAARIPIAEHSSPAVSGGRLYLRLRDSVGCYDLRPAGPDR